MQKGGLLDAVAECADISKAAAARSVDTVLEVITESLKKGNAVTLVGFGTFNVRRREARTGRNPRTGEPIQIKASNLAVFKAGKGLKDALN